MARGWAARFVSVAAIATVLAGCTSAPNRDGWWDEGIHEVDGYWITTEHPCSPEDDEGCQVAIDAAIAILRAREPDAVVTGAVAAGYPTRRGDDSAEITINIGGLQQPRFMILNLADGSRRTIGLSCGPGTSPAGTYPVYACEESEGELWRVTGG
jgi:hypothetical protein